MEYKRLSNEELSKFPYPRRMWDDKKKMCIEILIEAQTLSPEGYEFFKAAALSLAGKSYKFLLALFQVCDEYRPKMIEVKA